MSERPFKDGCQIKLLALKGLWQMPNKCINVMAKSVPRSIYTMATLLSMTCSWHLKQRRIVRRKRAGATLLCDIQQLRGDVLTTFVYFLGQIITITLYACSYILWLKNSHATCLYCKSSIFLFNANS